MRLPIALLASILLLTACATTRGPDENYRAYVEFEREQATAAEARFAAIAGTAVNCKEDSCVQQVAALAALAQAGGGGRSGSSLQPYRKQFHPAWGIVGAAVPALITGAVQWRQSETSRDVSLAQYDWLGGMMRDLSHSPALRAPAITVGGDYVTGTQHIGDDISGHIGDAIGRDAIAGDQHVGDAIGGDAIDGDAIGGDRVDGDGNYNSGRIGSPGPYDNDGDRCTGDNCQGTPPAPVPPVPADPPEGE